MLCWPCPSYNLQILCIIRNYLLNLFELFLERENTSGSSKLIKASSVYPFSSKYCSYSSLVSKESLSNRNSSTNSSLPANCLNFPLFSRLCGMPNLKICILFPCFCPYQQVTRESFCYSVFVFNSFPQPYPIALRNPASPPL